MLNSFLSAHARILPATATADELSTSLARNNKLIFCEGEKQPTSDTLNLLEEKINAGFLCLLIPTQNARHLPLAKIILNSLVDSTANQPLFWQMQTALHEVIFNAILHGNLEIHPKQDQQNLAMLDNLKMIDTVCAETDLGQRYIAIGGKVGAQQVELFVADEGHGFDYQRKLAEQPDVNITSTGRGLPFILKLATKVEFTRGGRCATLMFKQ